MGEKPLSHKAKQRKMSGGEWDGGRGRGYLHGRMIDRENSWTAARAAAGVVAAAAAAGALVADLGMSLDLVRVAGDGDSCVEDLSARSTCLLYSVSSVAGRYLRRLSVRVVFSGFFTSGLRFRTRESCAHTHTQRNPSPIQSIKPTHQLAGVTTQVNK